MNLKGYALSGDHALLAKLMQKQTIICLGHFRDQYPTFGKSLFDSSKGNDGRPNAGYRDAIGVGDWQRFRILAEPHWKIDASTEARFLEHCAKLNIRFLVPNESEPHQA